MKDKKTMDSVDQTNLGLCPTCHDSAKDTAEEAQRLQIGYVTANHSIRGKGV